MKILILQDNFSPSYIEGEGIRFFRFVQGLKQVGHQVFVLTTVQDKNQAGRSECQTIPVWRIYSCYHERWRAYLSLYNHQTVSSIKKIIKQIKPDIVHANNIHQYLSYYSLKIAKRYSRAVFLTANDVMSFHYGKLIECIDSNDLSVQPDFCCKVSIWQQIKRARKRYNPLRNPIIRHYLGYADKIFPISQALKKALKDNGIFNTEVIYTGIDYKSWQKDKREAELFKKKHGLFGKRVVFLARGFSEEKGINQIVKAMGKIVKELPDAVLMIGQEKEHFKKSHFDKILDLARKENVSVFSLSWTKRKELRSAYWASDTVVTPSIYLDPCPSNNLEAMACHRPVIATCFGGSREVVEQNKTGYIVNPFNLEDVAEKIIELLRDFKKAEKFGQAGYKRIVEIFSLDKQIEKTLKWYYENSIN